MNVVEAMDDPHLFRPWFEGPSWDGWRAVLKAAFALPMSTDELAFFRQVAEREPPGRRVRELWVVAGRRSGKDSIASLLAAHAGALFDGADRLRPGEQALALCLATDRDQARIVLGYARGYFEQIGMLADMVTVSVADGFELDTRVAIAIGTTNYRAPRGRPILLAVLDEVAFWRSDDSATPDVETYRAIVPGMATIPEAMLIGISSPYRKSGLLYQKHRDHFGRDSEDVLVIRAPSLLLNPTLDPAIVERALADDPAAARAEWLAEFRDDVGAFVAPEVVEGAVVPGRFEVPPVLGCRYVAFIDPAGGSGGDSFTLAIAHRENDTAVLDAVRETRPPFSPDAVTGEYAELLKAYGVRKVRGDRWGGEFPREALRGRGIEYKLSEQPKSDIYRDMLPMLNSGRVELLDLPRLKAQFIGLERRTARGGRDSIDHGPGGHDDIANVVAGALLMAGARKASMVVSQAALAQSRAPAPRQSRTSRKVPVFF